MLGFPWFVFHQSRVKLYSIQNVSMFISHQNYSARNFTLRYTVFILKKGIHSNEAKRKKPFSKIYNYPINAITFNAFYWSLKKKPM